jgi:hypothetical protein
MTLLAGYGDVAAFVSELAARQGVAFIANELDRFAAAVSRLADAEVQPDETADMLVALYRAGVLSSAESMALYSTHLKQIAG